MRKLALAATLFCPLTVGCATADRTAGENCCLVAGAVGAAALIELAFDAAFPDPEPKVDGSVESERKHFDWEQRQMADAYDFD
jgi:hypothetical protein